MKSNSLISFFILLAIAGIFTSCNKNRAKVYGRLAGVNSETVVLEQLTSEGYKTADSTTTNNNGNFELKPDITSGGATFFILRVDNNRIPLFISPGDKIRITSQFGNTSNYTINGSHESALLKEFNDNMRSGIDKLDSITMLWLTNPQTDKNQELIEAYTKGYNNFKREQIRFLVSNSGTLASVYAVFQTLPNGNRIFDSETDRIYFRMVADSAAVYYPKSPYVLALKSQVDSVESNKELERMLAENLNNPASYPEIFLPDIYGTKQRLSSNHGKVILLDFWSVNEPDAGITNAELKEIYNGFNRKDFEIYQVSLDTSKQLWVSTVLEQKLPWISVSDLQGIDGIIPRIYNVGRTRTNYLIDRNGNIVTRDITTDELRSEVEILISNPNR